MKWRVFFAVSMATAGLALTPAHAPAQTPLKIKPLAEKKVQSLPGGQLYWQIERFGTLSQAQAAAGPLGLAVESRGNAWLFRLGPADLPKSEGGEHMATVGPVPVMFVVDAGRPFSSPAKLD